MILLATQSWKIYMRRNLSLTALLFSGTAPNAKK
jgi:hypothetical protein